MKTRFLAALSTCAAAAMLLGCSANPSRTALGHIDLRLTDAPGDFDQVNVVVTGVSIHRDGSGWETVQQDTTTYDLLTLQNGVSTTLASSDVPSGHYTQVRLLLGDGSNVVVQGTAHPVEIPSGMETGLKLVGSFDVPAGGTIQMTLDFDAAHSILKMPDGSYVLKPVIRLTPAQ
jgi:uncharacterized protein DUF4382